MSYGAIGIPVYGPPSWSLLASLFNLKASSGFGLILSSEPDRPKPIDEACNFLVEKMLAREECKWLLIMAADAKVHPQTLERLLSWNKPIVAGLSFTRRLPIRPTVCKGTDEGVDGYYVQFQGVLEWLGEHKELLTGNPWVLDPVPAGALFDSDFTGTHVMLIRREVFEKLKPPWFKLDDTGTSGEDRYFCEKVREAGYKVYTDLSVVTGHLHGPESVVTAIDFIAWNAISDWSNKKWKWVLEDDGV